MKEYTIKPTKGFLPPIEYWIFDDLKISKIETAMLYKIILKNNPLTWNSAYIGKILHLSKSTVMRIVDDLCKKNVIEKKKKSLWQSITLGSCSKIQLQWKNKPRRNK